MKKNYFLVLMIIMMLFTACAKTPEAYIEKAEKVEKQEPDKAIEYYEAALELDEWNQDAWLGIAEVYADEEDYEELNDLLKDINKDLDEFDDEEDMLDELIEYAELILEEEPEELGKWAMDIWPEEVQADTDVRAEIKIESVFASDPIKFGMFAALAGDYGIYGIAARNGAQMAIDEINAKNGVLGREIELVTYDSEGDPTKALSLYDRLRDQDGIDALIGGVFSGESITVGPMADNDEMPMLSPTATNKLVTEDLGYVFRTCFVDSYQGEVAAAFAREVLDADSAVVMRNVGSEYSSDLVDSFKYAFDGEIVADEGYTDGDVDFTGIAAKINTLNPDVVFIPDYSNMAAVIVEALRLAGVDAEIIGGDGWDGIADRHPVLTDGCYYVNHFSQFQDEKTKSFVKSYELLYGETPNALSALGYDAVYIMAEAFELAGSVDGDRVQNALKATSYKGITGKIEFDNEGNPRDKGAVIMRITNGEAEFYGRMTK